MERIIRLLCLKLTYKCNLNCFMCGQRKMSERKLNQELDFNYIKELLGTCGKTSYGVYLWGGEPLVYSRFDELIDYLHSNRIFTTINTNGVNLNRFEEKLISYDGYSKIIISLDGIGNIHDKIRGKQGTFQSVKQNIESINKKRSKGLILSSNTVITSENHENLFEIISGISELGMDMMECQLPMFFSEACGQAYEHSMSQFGLKANSWKGFAGDYSSIQVPNLMEELSKIRSKFGRKFKLMPNFDNTALENYFINPEGNVGKKKCSLPNGHFNVEPNGDVVICPDFPDYVIGNIYDEKMERIWNGEKMNHFRLLLEKKNLPICSRCCNFFQF